MPTRNIIHAHTKVTPRSSIYRYDSSSRPSTLTVHTPRGGRLIQLGAAGPETIPPSPGTKPHGCSETLPAGESLLSVAMGRSACSSGILKITVAWNKRLASLSFVWQIQTEFMIFGDLCPQRIRAHLCFHSHHAGRRKREGGRGNECTSSSGFHWEVKQSASPHKSHRHSVLGFLRVERSITV